MYKRPWYHWLDCPSSIPLLDEFFFFFLHTAYFSTVVQFRSFSEFSLLRHYIHPFFPFFFFPLEMKQKGNWLYCSEPDWMTRLDVSLSPPPTLIPPSSCLFIAEGIHQPLQIVISTTQYMVSSYTPPTYNSEPYFLCVLPNKTQSCLLWSVVCSFQGLLLRRRTAVDIWWRGRRSHWLCYRNQFQRWGEQLGSPMKLLPLLTWNVTLAVRHGAF